ncbi:DUF5689 domain-containing protein [Flavobacterium aciduliphilum]|uniref:Uncharacterized protein DUF5017 n=1 Tax=Flavobacterium aciduliphilum TaxID=1101402 RepID=A0A328YDU2_9FLAO|nr:DUF5689 domain-containing protein [Flavobacterium aciduliphilum]RAR71303.1 uncharacterized protein DUF5017 [Flavobacterium aciduliphilum]
MKKKLNLVKSSFLLALFIALSSCTDSDKSYQSGAPEIQTYAFTPTITVASLNSIATPTPTQYAADDIIEAYVTSNDAAGNFYKSISFQDVQIGTSTPIGFSVAVDKAMTYADGFYPGRKVYIKLKGLYYGIQYGSLKIGVDASLNGIEPLDYQKFLFPSATVVDESTLLRHMTLANALSNANLNTLVEVDNVQFAKGSLGRTYFDIDSGGYATNQMIEDPNLGTTSICRISKYAPFSVNMVPSGMGSIRGVMTKYNTDFQYMVRYESDFKLTGARFIPALSEDFNNGLTAWNAYSVSGAQVWGQASYGNPAPCASISGYSGGNKANEDWLISPVMNFSTYTNVTLTFDSAYNYPGAPIQVLVSSNYTGTGNPNSATWTPLSPILSTGSFAWVNSGPVSLSAFAGNNTVYVAFKYTSTTSAASTWEIDNVKVIGN